MTKIDRNSLYKTIYDIPIQKVEITYLRYTAIKNIIKIVKGKKDSSKVTGEEKKTLENQLMGQCFMNDVNPIDPKTSKFIGYSKLKYRIAQRKNLIKG